MVGRVFISRASIVLFFFVHFLKYGIASGVVVLSTLLCRHYACSLWVIRPGSRIPTCGLRRVLWGDGSDLSIQAM
jgi:hypothetical protein